MSSIKALIQALAQAWPSQANFPGVAWEGHFYPSLSLARGGGWLVKPGRDKSFLIPVSGSYVVLPLDEEAEKVAVSPLSSWERERGLEEAPTLKAAKLNLISFAVNRREYGVFSAVELMRKEWEEGGGIRYLILQEDELLATFTATWLKGEEQDYRYFSTPSWMYAKVKLARVHNPGLYVDIGLLRKGRRRCIYAKKLLAVDITSVSAEEAEVSVEIREVRPSQEARVTRLLERLRREEP